MTRHIVWVCDRCEAVQSGDNVEKLQGWERVATDGSVIDVCPDCLTSDEWMVLNTRLVYVLPPARDRG